MSNKNKKVSFFLKLLRVELKNCEEIYGTEGSRPLKRYYKTFQKPGKFFDYAQFYYIRRIMPLIKYIKTGKKILDAGCGLGTESILFCFHGANVVGVDIRDDRIKTAKLRVKYFEKKLDIHIDVKFNFENILNHYGQYDIIWLNEAISHINPLDKLIYLCYENLNNDGKLIIADANKLNPIIYYRSKLEQYRYGGKIKTFPIKDPNTNKEISYAVERIFSIPMIKLLLSNLFKVLEVYPIGYFPYFMFKFFPRLSKYFENIFSNIPIVKLLSGIYCIVLKKKKIENLKQN